MRDSPYFPFEASDCASASRAVTFDGSTKNLRVRRRRLIRPSEQVECLRKVQTRAHQFGLELERSLEKPDTVVITALFKAHGAQNGIRNGCVNRVRESEPRLPLGIIKPASANQFIGL